MYGFKIEVVEQSVRDVDYSLRRRDRISAYADETDPSRQNDSNIVSALLLLLRRIRLTINLNTKQIRRVYSLHSDSHFVRLSNQNHFVLL